MIYLPTLVKVTETDLARQHEYVQICFDSVQRLYSELQKVVSVDIRELSPLALDKAYKKLSSAISEYNMEIEDYEAMHRWLSMSDDQKKEYLDNA